MTWSLAIIHDDGVSASVGQPLFDITLHVLAEFGAASHLHKVMGVKSNVGVFYHVVP